MPKKKNREATPETTFQHIWLIGEGKTPRFRGCIAFYSAKDVLEQYYASLGDQDLCKRQAELNANTAYYAYYLELLHAEQEVFCQRRRVIRRLRLFRDTTACCDVRLTEIHTVQSQDLSVLGHILASYNVFAHSA